jgi:hypothetical protein
MEPAILSFSPEVATVTVAATGPEEVIAARSAGAEGEKSAGMAAAALLVSGSKGAAEQTRSRETALRVRRVVFH